MRQLEERRGYGLPVNAPVTREGEVELAKQFEKGETLILEALIASGIEARAVLLGDPSRDDFDTATAPFYTPRRLEVVSAYVECLEAVQALGLSGDARASKLRALIPHRDLTRKLIGALRARFADTGGPMGLQVDPRLRLGLAVSDAAREDLLRANLGIVNRIANKFIHRGLSPQDLVQEGYIGLMRAIEKFDYRRGHRFIVYASWWVRSRITRALAYTSMSIRVPSHVRVMQHKLNAAKTKLTQLEWETPEAALATRLDISEERVKEYSNIVKQPLSFEMKRDRTGEGDLTLESTIADTESPPPDEVVADFELTRRVLKHLKRLKPREQEMLRLRYGIGKSRDHTLQEVGDRYGLSRERVRQIERAALKKLRVACEAADKDVPASVG